MELLRARVFVRGVDIGEVRGLSPQAMGAMLAAVRDAHGAGLPIAANGPFADAAGGSARWAPRAAGAAAEDRREHVRLQREVESAADDLLAAVRGGGPPDGPSRPEAEALLDDAEDRLEEFEAALEAAHARRRRPA